MATVIQLGKKCGISNAVEVDTFYYLPSLVRGIKVKGAETIHGRKISFVTVYIDREKWSGKEAKKESGVLRSIGEFWVSHDHVVTNVLTTFSVKGDTIRVYLSDDVPLATADKIVDAFADGRIRFLSDFDKMQLERVDLSKPESLSYTKEGFHIYYSDRSSQIVLDFRLDGSGVAVTAIGHIYV